MNRRTKAMKRLSSEYSEIFLEWWLDHTEDDGEPDNDWHLARKWAYDGWEAASDYHQEPM